MGEVLTQHYLQNQHVDIFLAFFAVKENVIIVTIQYEKEQKRNKQTEIRTRRKRSFPDKFKTHTVNLCIYFSYNPLPMGV